MKEFADWTDTELAHARPSNLTPREAAQLRTEITARQTAGNWNPQPLARRRLPRKGR